MVVHIIIAAGLDRVWLSDMQDTASPAEVAITPPSGTCTKLGIPNVSSELEATLIHSLVPRPLTRNTFNASRCGPGNETMGDTPSYLISEDLDFIQ